MQFGGIVDLDWSCAVGMSFYGDPFGTAGPWQEENAIGALWQRLMSFLEEYPQAIAKRIHDDQMIEVHFETNQTARTGCFEVFIGTIVSRLQNVPYQCVAKQIPQVPHALFTLHGAEISSDWWGEVQRSLSAQGLRVKFPYVIQLYDARYLGTQRIAESVLEVLLPVRSLEDEED